MASSLPCAPISVFVALLLLSSASSASASASSLPWSVTHKFQSLMSAISRRSLAEAGASRPLDWRPQEGKYLLALCLQGAMSDQLRCIKKTFQLAGILNRTLLVSPPAVAFVSEQQSPPWDWSNVVDFARMRECLDKASVPNAVYTVPEYLQKVNQNTLQVDKITCAVPGSPLSTGCYHTKLANAFQEAAKGTITLPHADENTLLTSPLTSGRRQLQEGAQEGSQAPATIDEIARAFGSVQDAVLCLGDVSALEFEQPGGLFSNATLSESCVNYWRPCKAVMSFVDGILDTLLGDQYAGLHWRRGPSLPVPDVATKVRTILKDADVPVLYVATDARKPELETLEVLMKEQGFGKRFAALLTLRTILVDEEWLLQQFWSKDALLMEKDKKNGVALSLVDKYVCARARYFVGTEGSKFTRDILDYRREEGLSNPPGMGDYF